MALQPFSLVHSVVHTVAAPVVEKAPRILRAVATAPIRAVVARAERADDYEQEDEAGERRATDSGRVSKRPADASDWATG